MKNLLNMSDSDDEVEDDKKLKKLKNQIQKKTNFLWKIVQMVSKK
jgi:hypothetical protein